MRVPCLALLHLCSRNQGPRLSGATATHKGSGAIGLDLQGHPLENQGFLGAVFGFRLDCAKAYSSADAAPTSTVRYVHFMYFWTQQTEMWQQLESDRNR